MGRLLLVSGRMEDLAKESNYDANQLARLCGISTRHLQRHFRKYFRRSPQNWLDECRMIEAQKLLIQGESVKKVAIDLGFKHPSHFCHQFKRRYKVTPTQFAVAQATNVADTQQMSLSIN